MSQSCGGTDNKLKSKCLKDKLKDLASCICPTYPELGKDARDIFGKGFYLGLLQLNVKTKSVSDVEISSGVQYTQETSKIFGNLQSKYKLKDYGLTFTEKWNTDNVVGTEITCQDQFLKGLKVSLDTSLVPHTGVKTGKIKTSFVQKCYALTCDVELDRAGPIIDASAVLKFKNWLAGYQTQFNAQENSFTKNNLAVDFVTSDFILHTYLDNGANFGGSIYQKASLNLDVGVMLKWSPESSETTFGVGCKYKIDPETYVRAKVNNVGHVGFGYQQTLRDGITLTLSALIDGLSLDGGDHKVGAALEFVS